MDIKDLPKEDGWYWVLIDGYSSNNLTPCWYYYDTSNVEESYFLAGGLGDSSSAGLFHNDISKVVSKIKMPDVDNEYIQDIQNRLIHLLHEAEDNLDSSEFDFISESIIHYIDEISRRKK